MAEEIASSGLIRISNESDRVTIATILYKNGYTVRPVQSKKGSRNVYFVEYSTQSTAPKEQEGGA